MVAAMVVATGVTLALQSGDSSAPGITVELLPTPTVGKDRTAEPPPTATAIESTPVDSPGSLGFAYPIAGACLPEDNSLMPGAPREYRNGIHEGVDFYDSDNCTGIGFGTEILAVGSGTVIRADWEYEDLTPERLAELEALVQEGASGASDTLDVFRGRQVWIDHGDGVVTRYAHLNGIAEGLAVGERVQQGDTIGYAGESGTPESVTNPGTEGHLHFEIRIGDSYLGSGLDAVEVRELYRRAFSP